MTDGSQAPGSSTIPGRPGQMTTALFGPRLYAKGDDLADQLQLDVSRIPQLRRQRSPEMADQLLHPQNPVGRYDTAVRGLALVENSTVARAHRIGVADRLRLATDAPARLRIGSTHEPVLTVFSRHFTVPPTDFWRGVADQLYGFGWCLVDQTRLCPECVHGAGVPCVFGAAFDYFHFMERLSDIAEESRRAMAAYIDHGQRHGPQSRECAAMDSWMACLQALYLDVLHPKATTISVGRDEQRSIRYRILNSAARPLALLTAQERPSSVIDDQVIEAAGFACMVMHDACDRRHDNTAKESYNFFTLLAAHNKAECLVPVQRFCVDLWAWAIDRGTSWPILLAGRMLVRNIYMARYQTPILLDHLIPPAGTSADPYADPVLNRMNPAPRAALPGDLSIRNTCKDKSAYDRLLDASLAHFADCPGCRGYEHASWRERVVHLDAGYRRKAEDDCTCVDRMAAYTILALLDRVWWAADPSARYTGPTAEWDPYLV